MNFPQPFASAAAALTPFMEFTFMRRALVACLALSASGAPLGTLLIQRRMALVGDAMAHAVLPGAAVGYLSAGLSLWAMAAGGLTSAIVVAATAGLIARRTAQREDTSFAAIYLIALSGGVLLASLSSSKLDLLHMLFGTVLAVDDAGLFLVAGIATFILLALAILFRPIVIDSFDRRLLLIAGSRGAWAHMSFMILIVLNLVAGFQVLGTLMSVGLLILPAASARFWVSSLDRQILFSMCFGVIASFAGLLASYHAGLPSGPCIVLIAGAGYLLSALLGRLDSARRQYLRNGSRTTRDSSNAP